MAGETLVPSGRVLLVGLGNPGARYDRTRHNIGFDVVGELCRRWSIPLNEKKFKGLLGSGVIAGRPASVLLPQTFMNLSGESVGPAMGFWRLTPASVIVCHDDIDLQPGQVRLKLGGGHGGHNGLRSMDQHLPSKDYFRIRLGVGRPPVATMDVAVWVLARFGADESQVVERLVSNGADAVERLIRDGLQASQNAIHALG